MCRLRLNYKEEARTRLPPAIIAFAVVATLVGTLAHAQTAANVAGPEPCSWYASIPDIPPSPQRIIVAPSVATAALIHRVNPVYPADAKVEGTVVLCAIIAKSGVIERLQSVSGPALLMAAAVDAVKQWRYKPTQLNGNPVEVETKVLVEFRLKRDLPLHPSLDDSHRKS